MKTKINFLLLGFLLFFLACEKEEIIEFKPPTVTTTDATDITTTGAKIGMGVTAIGTGIISEYGIGKYDPFILGQNFWYDNRPRFKFYQRLRPRLERH